MRITIENVGVFDINEERLPQLLDFLARGSAIKIEESNSIKERIAGKFSGRELLNG